jgi:predicted pyridoxine 5'-phosphate oxidase superfamily flavin-nucleotide-binding protein
MASPDPRYDVATLADLEGPFPEPVKEASLAKEIDHIDANYRTMIEASPFFVLATVGPGGLDCSPRGDSAGFVSVPDEKTLLASDCA